MTVGKLSRAKIYLKDSGFPNRVDSAIILGSGLSDFAEHVKNKIEIPYQNIPEFHATTVEGHDGTLIYGTVQNHPVLVFSGRFHHYEGHPISSTVLPIHLSEQFSVNKIIISNAAGAVNTDLEIGDLVVINSLFRLFQKISAGPSERYDYNLYRYADKTRKIGIGIGLDLKSGTYLYAKGPNYETKAEIRAFQRLGVDVVGMSTVPELMEAAKLNIPAAAISLVTNMAAGLGSAKLDHSDVKEAAIHRKEDFARLVIELIQKL